MKYASTRGGQEATLEEALLAGIAADGGLFVPVALPSFSPADFAGDRTLTAVARRLLAPFFAGSGLAGSLDDIVRETFTFPIPLRDVPGQPGLRLLELFHGPTAAFKDVGAGFLTACISRLAAGAEQPLTILVATSGDTGGAVAAAFDGRAEARVVVLFPEGRVSRRQAHQLCCWGDNVLSLAVQGNFDDCQRLVKLAMGDRRIAGRWRLSSANSINIGRLLPQCTYYAHACLTRFRATGEKSSFVIPTGNLGNALACMLVRAMGLPVRNIVLATNANRAIPDWLESGEWRPAPGIPTLATAMDVGDPSNMERLRRIFGGRAAPDLGACAATDEDIRTVIRDTWREYGIAVCPHTATAVHAWRRLPAQERADSEWILAATAHPAKFEDVVEPLIGEEVPLPAALARVLSRPTRSVRVPPELNAVAAALAQAFAP